MKSAAEIGQAILERLAAQAAANRAAGDHLRAEVRAVVGEHPENFTGKQVIKKANALSAPIGAAGAGDLESTPCRVCLEGLTALSR